MAVIKQVDVNSTLYDLDNRYIILSNSSGTLTNDQLAILRASTQNYIVYTNGMYGVFRQVLTNRPPGTTSSTMYYSYGDSSGRVQWCYINGLSYSFSTTAPDVRSDNSTAKLYLIGGESQSQYGTTTHSNSNVYEQAGTLYANQVTLASAPSNDTDASTKKYVDDSISAAELKSVTIANTSGTLSSEDLATLQANDNNYIIYSNGIYRLVAKNTSNLYYQRVAATSSIDQYFNVTISSRAYTYSTVDPKNTTGSTDTSSKIYLVGATSQAANPQTYSDNQIYATNGQLDANIVRIAENVSLVYNSITSSLNFNFT